MVQQVFVVWDTGSNGSAYKPVNDALRRGASVVSVSSAAPSSTHGTGGNLSGSTWAVTTFVLEGSDEQLGLE